MNYENNKEQIINDNLKSTNREIIEEFLDSPMYREWISGYEGQPIQGTIQEFIASGIRLWQDGFL